MVSDHSAEVVQYLLDDHWVSDPSAEVVQYLLDVPELRVDEIRLHELGGVAVLVELGPHVLRVLSAQK